MAPVHDPEWLAVSSGIDCTGHTYWRQLEEALGLKEDLALLEEVHPVMQQQ